MKSRWPQIALAPSYLAKACCPALKSPAVLACLLGVGCSLAAACNAENNGDDSSSLRPTPDSGAVPEETPDAGGPNEEMGEPQTFGGPRGPYFEEVDVGYDALLETFVDYARFFCVCETGQSAGDEYDACVDSYGDPYPPPLLACTKTVLSRSASALDSLRCELGNAETYIECIQESTCIDFTHITGCETDRIIRGLDCEDVPYDVWADDQALCYGREIPPGFECADGEIIDPTYECDFAEDCADGSDETDCPDPHAGLDL